MCAIVEVSELNTNMKIHKIHFLYISVMKFGQFNTSSGEPIKMEFTNGGVVEIKSDQYAAGTMIFLQPFFSFTFTRKKLHTQIKYM